MTQGLPSAPIPTLPARCRMRLPRQWAISWRSSCKRQNNVGKPDRNGNFLSGTFWPFPMLSYCGSGRGSGLTHTLTHRLNPQNSKEKVLLSKENRTFWSCWADSNRRPHPYQRGGGLKEAYYYTSKALILRHFLLLFVSYRSLSVRPVLQRQ